MRELNYNYSLRLAFDCPVSRYHFTLRCFPQDDEHQKLLNCCRDIYPAAKLCLDHDGFGAEIAFGQVTGPCIEFRAEISGTVIAGITQSVVGDSTDGIFRCPTPLTAADQALRDFAAGIADSKDAYDTACSVMEAVSQRMTYQPGTTDVATTAAEAFHLGCGVCQDYTHIMLAVLRLKGIPARYTVGLLEGEGQTHAWAEVCCSGRWFGFDPTNAVTVSDRHIKFSHGRDYGDCQVCRGHIYGYARQEQMISAIVKEV